MNNLHKRFLAKVNKTDTCWLWTASVIRGGYGRIATGNSVWDLAHRVSWRLYRGSLPSDLCVLHRCDVRACVNPDHLFLGTRADNQRDAITKGRNSRGDIHGSAKLTESQAREIKVSRLPNVELARRFHVSDSLVSSIKHGRFWKHI